VSDRGALPKLTFRPLKKSTWADFEKLFGKRGACGGCWCMWWRMRRSDFHRTSGEQRRRAMKKIVESGSVPGILAYAGRQPVGWVSVAPREDFPVLGRSRVLKPIDDTPVWSVVCFFVRNDFRRRGMTKELLRAAIDHVRRGGGRVVEGYPVDTETGDAPGTSVFTGVASAFRRVGFRECARRSEKRPIMRYSIDS
jgi:GNAT superfamily N-acetyltransferase